MLRHSYPYDAVTFSGGALDGLQLTNRASVASIARRAQFGEQLEFDRLSGNADGVLRTSPRGWFTFAHITFSLLYGVVQQHCLSGVLGFQGYHDPQLVPKASSMDRCGLLRASSSCLLRWSCSHVGLFSSVGTLPMWSSPYR